MLTELCGYLKNWFVTEMLYGDFIITNGVITYADGKALPLQSGQYFRIIRKTSNSDGALFNDGVFMYSNEGIEPALVDESWKGSIWTMAIPQEVLEYAEQISAWKTKYENIDSQALSPFSSESFQGYSYNKQAGADGSGGAGWQSIYGPKLARYRKV